MKIRWIEAGTVPYIRSQSLYHGLGYAQKKETKNTVVLATPESPYMCIGHFQDTAKEIDFQYCRKNNLPVIRRETGGGGVYIDNGQLFVQWIFQREDLPRNVEQRFQMFLKPIVETYKFFGIEAKIYPPNDVHVNGKKIVGTGAATIGNAEVVTGNFLFHFNTKSMTNALNLPSELFREQMRVGLDQYLTTFKKETGKIPDLSEVIEVYKSKCKQLFEFDFTYDTITPDENEAIELMDQKLQDEEWLYSIHTKPERQRLVKIHAGVWLGLMIHPIADNHIEVFIRMIEGKIDFVRIQLEDKHGSDSNWTDLESRLLGTSINEAEVSKVISEYFNNRQGINKFSIPEWVEAILKIQKEKQRVFGYA